MPRHSKIDCCGNGLISRCIVIRKAKTFVESLWFAHVRIRFLCTLFCIRNSNVRIVWKGFDRLSDFTQTIGALSFVADFSWTKTACTFNLTQNCAVGQGRELSWWRPNLEYHKQYYCSADEAAKMASCWVNFCWGTKTCWCEFKNSDFMFVERHYIVTN